MSRRDEILREMGLTPVWRLRERTPVEVTSVAADAAARAPAASDTVSAAAGSPPSARAPLTSTGAADRAPLTSTGAADRAPLTSTGAADRAPLTPAAAAARAPLTSEAAAARAADILALDWPALRTRVAGCVDCPLHERRNCTVFGVGDERADWLFVGEGPGAEEDQQGEPFVGQAGKLLDAMLAAIRLKRGENVYIANTVKCRPPGNRNPERDEALACEPYLRRQIQLLQPRIIVALGKVAAVNLLGREATIAALRGKVHDYAGIPLVVTYHPAYLLRTLPDKAKAWEDLCFAVATLQDLQSRPGAPS